MIVIVIDIVIIILIPFTNGKEMRRVFEVCHGCRLCFNLCDSFPKLFELIDGSKNGDLESVPSSSFKVN